MTAQMQNGFNFAKAERGGFEVPDGRFRALLGEAAWKRLAAPVRSRFSRKLIGAASLVYQGAVTKISATFPGRLLAQSARIIGAPLPLDLKSTGTAAVVSVTEDVAGGGQFWSRAYGRPNGFPQIIHSSKRFCGPTGLEEYVGCGLTMALTVREDDGGLVFESAGFAFSIGNQRIAIPGWLIPFRVTVRHDDLGHDDNGNACFAFRLIVSHNRLGKIIAQTAVFGEGRAVAGAGR